MTRITYGEDCAYDSVYDLTVSGLKRSGWNCCDTGIAGPSVRAALLSEAPVCSDDSSFLLAAMVSGKGRHIVSRMRLRCVEE